MLLALRKILFYILLVLYLVITPYLILYGLGYVFNPSEGELLKTGLISIASEPKGASIYIESRKFSQKTPAVVRGMRPGVYRVRVAHKGFEAWEKKIQILPEKAIRLDPVVLVPKQPETEPFSALAYQSLFPKISDYKIFALAGDRLSDLMKVDLLFKKEAPLHQKTKDDSGSEISLLDWTAKKDSGVILFKTNRAGQSGSLLYDLDREKIVKDLTGKIPEKTDAMDWAVKKPEAVYFLKDHRLNGFQFEGNKIFPITQEDVLGFGIQRSKLYFLKKDFSFWQSNLQGENITPLSKREDTGARVFSATPSKIFKIEVIKRELFQKELLLFLSDRGVLLSNWPPYRLVEGGVLGFKHTTSGDSEKILYWTENEIGMFNFAFNSEDEEALPPKMVLYRSGTHIRQAYWAYENSHIVFQDESEVFLLEAGDHAPYLVRAIQTVAKGPGMIYNDHQHTLYYLDFASHKLVKRKMTE